MFDYDEGQTARVAGRRVAVRADFEDIDHHLDFTDADLDYLRPPKWYYEGVYFDDIDHDF